MGMYFLSSSICSSSILSHPFPPDKVETSAFCVLEVLQSVHCEQHWILHSESVLLSEIISLAAGLADRLIPDFFLLPALPYP